jgi:hypothetical protein
MKRVDPAVERVEDRQREAPTRFPTGIGVERAVLAVGFDPVEVGEVLERDGGPPVLGEQGRMKLAADVQGGDPLWMQNDRVTGIQGSARAPFDRTAGNVLRG